MPVQLTEWPKCSVVISTYNRPALLSRALASVHGQTYTDYEVLVVDDCTPDEASVQKVLDEWEPKFAAKGVDLFGLRLGENSGYQCMPKNMGIEMARGDYIAYLDDDNEWTPDHLSVTINALEYKAATETEGPGNYSKPNFSVDMVYTRLTYLVDDGVDKEKWEKETGAPLPEGDAPLHEWKPEILSQRNFVDTSAIVHSKGAFWNMVREQGYGWDVALRRFGDWNFVWRWAVCGNNARAIDAVTVKYHWQPSGLQLTRPLIEIPVTTSYGQWSQMRRERANPADAA